MVYKLYINKPIEKDKKYMFFIKTQGIKKLRDENKNDNKENKQKSPKFYHQEYPETES